MAPLSRGTDGSDGSDRGQIILIAAFTLAVIFVALALVLNSAIFTENLASRGEVTGSSEALTYLHQANESVADAIEHANRRAASNPGTLEDSLRASVSAFGRQGGTQQITGGQIVNVSLVSSASSPTYGYRVADNTSGGSTFENESTPTAVDTWRLAGGVSETRNLQITVGYRSSLAGTASNAVTIRANESGDPADAWELRLWDDGSNLVLDVDTASGRSATCRIPAPDDVEIDVMAGVAGGQRCHALTRTGPNGDPMFWGTGLPAGDYEIWIENGDRVEGNYSMIVDESATPASNNLAGSATGADPYVNDAIYSAEIDYVFRSSKIEYEATARVARGESPA